MKIQNYAIVMVAMLCAQPKIAHGQFNCIVFDSYEVLSRVPTQNDKCKAHVQLCLLKNTPDCAEVHFQLNNGDGALDYFKDVLSERVGSRHCHIFKFTSDCSDNITLTGYGMNANNGFCGVWADYFPLPVELISFEARQIKEAIEIEWEVAQEINIKEYFIEKLLDGFQPIGIVKADADDQELYTYSFNDNKITEGLNTYRLRIVENNGKTSYSDVVVVSLSANLSDHKVQIYPQPAQNHVIVESSDEVTSLVSVLGQKFAVVYAGDNKIDVSNLPSGMYMALSKSKIVGRVIKQ